MFISLHEASRPDWSRTLSQRPLTACVLDSVTYYPHVDEYFAESEPGHKANVSSLGHLLTKQFPGIAEDWAGQRSLSQLLKKVCRLNVDQVENKTLAWKE